MYLVLLFWAVTLFDGGRALWNGDIVHALAVVGGSLLAFAAGGGLRGSLHLGNPKAPALAIAGIIFGASLALMHFLDLTIDFFDGRVWAVIGATVGFFAARKEDALPPATARPDGSDEAAARKTLEAYREAVVKLGAIMEDEANHAFPESKLPLPKAEMKNALKAMWLIIDDNYMKGAIEAGYSHLAYFRSDLEKPVSLEFGVEDATGDDGEPDLIAIKNMQGRVGFFQTINAEAIELAAEFQGFKAAHR